MECCSLFQSVPAASHVIAHLKFCRGSVERVVLIRSTVNDSASVSVMLHSNYDYAIVLRDFVVNEIPWLTLICVFSFSHWRTHREYLETIEVFAESRGNALDWSGIRCEFVLDSGAKSRNTEAGQELILQPTVSWESWESSTLVALLDWGRLGVLGVLW